MPVRRPARPTLLGATALLALATAAPALAAPGGDGVALTPRGTHVTGQFDESAAEIVEHDPRTQRWFVVNALSGGVRKRRPCRSPHQSVSHSGYSRGPMPSEGRPSPWYRTGYGTSARSRPWIIT